MNAIYFFLAPSFSTKALFDKLSGTVRGEFTDGSGVLSTDIPLSESVPDSLKFTNHRWRPFSAGSPAFLRSRTSNTGSGVREHSGDWDSRTSIRKLNHQLVRCGRKKAPGGGLQSRGNAPSVVAALGFGSCPADGTLKLLTKRLERKGFFFFISETLPLVLITMPSTDRPTDKKASRVHWTRRSRGRVAAKRRTPPPTSAHTTAV